MICLFHGLVGKAARINPMALSEIHQSLCSQVELKKGNILVIFTAFLGIFELFPQAGYPVAFSLRTPWKSFDE